MKSQKQKQKQSKGVCNHHSGIEVVLKTIQLTQMEIKQEVKEINSKLERVPVLWEISATTRKMTYGAYTAVGLALGWLYYHISQGR